MFLRVNMYLGKLMFINYSLFMKLFFHWSNNIIEIHQ